MTLLYLRIASVLEMIDDKKFKIDLSGNHATFSLKKVKVQVQVGIQCNIEMYLAEIGRCRLDSSTPRCISADVLVNITTNIQMLR